MPRPRAFCFGTPLFFMGGACWAWLGLLVCPVETVRHMAFGCCEAAQSAQGTLGTCGHPGQMPRFPSRLGLAPRVARVPTPALDTAEVTRLSLAHHMPFGIRGQAGALGHAACCEPASAARAAPVHARRGHVPPCVRKRPSGRATWLWLLSPIGPETQGTRFVH